MLIFVVSILTILTGQFVVQSPQPLQISSLNVTLPLATLTPPIPLIESYCSIGFQLHPLFTHIHLNREDLAFHISW